MKQQVSNWSQDMEEIRRRSAIILRLRMRPLEPSNIEEDVECGDCLLTFIEAARLPWLPRLRMSKKIGHPHCTRAMLDAWSHRGLETIYVPCAHGRTGVHLTTQGALKRFLGVKSGPAVRTGGEAAGHGGMS